MGGGGGKELRWGGGGGGEKGLGRLGVMVSGNSKLNYWVKNDAEANC